MSRIQKIEIINWYIVQGVINGDVLLNGNYQFKQFNIMKYEPITNKIWLTIHESSAEVNQDLTPEERKHQLAIEMTTDKGGFELQVYGAILNWDKVDKWFIINKKLDNFKQVLNGKK